MSKLNKNNNLLVALLLTASFLIIAYVMYQNTTQPIQQNTSLFDTSEALPPTPTPTASITKPKNNTLSQPSPEGAMMLTIKTKEKPTGETDYTIFVKEKDSKEIAVFNDTLQKGTTVEIPFNTWSPDNQHFFIKVVEDGTDNYLVFKASGEKFEEDMYINATDIFIEDEVPYDLKQITGWAAPYLLLAQTTHTQTGKETPSYWFEVPSQRYIQLSTRF